MRERQLKNAIITVRLPSAVKDALQRAADEDMRSLASLTTKVLTDFVREQGLLGSAKSSRKGGGR
jgi:hypothetical protein